MKFLRILFAISILSLVQLGYSQTIRTQTENSDPQPLEWRVLENGLEWTEAEPHLRCNIGDNLIRIVRIDPRQFDLTLLNAKELKIQPQTAEQWVQKQSVIAVINAGMYQQDFLTSVGYMKNYDFVNQARKNKDNTILAFNRQSETVPHAQIIDLTCQNWEELKNQYHSFVQGIRMIDCTQKNRWGQQARYWSISSIAVDTDGNILLLHSRTPWSVRDFIQIIQRLPLNIYNAMYLEGGPEASLHLKHPQKTVSQMGSYETGFWESNSNQEFWPIPNVIGVKRRASNN